MVHQNSKIFQVVGPWWTEGGDCGGLNVTVGGNSGDIVLEKGDGEQVNEEVVKLFIDYVTPFACE